MTSSIEITRFMIYVQRSLNLYPSVEASGVTSAWSIMVVRVVTESPWGQELDERITQTE